MRKRKLTEEQQAKRDARKAKMRSLAKEISDMTAEARAEMAAQFPVVTIEGRMLSGFNQCLVARQMPTATVVGGFRQWIKAGRAVMKGQSGLCIWVPIGTKKEESAPRPEASEGGEDESRARFILGTVFDVSQTQEIETGTPEVVSEDEQPTPEAPTVEAEPEEAAEVPAVVEGWIQPAPEPAPVAAQVIEQPRTEAGQPLELEFELVA